MMNSTAAITTLLFDWDGTLSDSAHLGFAAFQKTFQDLGIAFHQEIYEASYSPNWYSMYEAFALPRDQWQRADELWVRHYGEQVAQPVAGAKETILKLEQKGYRLGIVSSGSHRRVRREIDELGLGSTFQVVVCNEHTVNKKPHPEGLEIAMRQLSMATETCSYIGDSPEDIQMGKSAQVLTVGVRSAYPSSKHLLSAQPDLYLESITDLLRHF